MATTGRSAAWSKTVDLVRHGGKLPTRSPRQG
jgi:hypothetical protein